DAGDQKYKNPNPNGGLDHLPGHGIAFDTRTIQSLGMYIRERLKGIADSLLILLIQVFNFPRIDLLLQSCNTRSCLWNDIGGSLIIARPVACKIGVMHPVKRIGDEHAEWNRRGGWRIFHDACDL